MSMLKVARILGKSEVASRQIVHRARLHVRRDRPRFAVSESARTALLALFAEDATWTSDGGHVVAARRVVRDAERLIRFVLGIVRRVQGKATYHVAPISGKRG